MLKKWQISGVLILLLLSPWLSILNRSIYSAHLIVIVLLISSILKVSNVKFSPSLFKKFLKTRMLPVGFILILLVLLLINGFESINKYSIIYLFEILLMLVLIKEINSFTIFETAFNVFCYFTVLISVIGVLEALTDFRLPYSLYMLRDFSIYDKSKIEYMLSQPTAIYYNPNDFSTLLVIGFGMFLGKIKIEGPRFKLILCVLLLLLGVVLSSSRANLLAIIFVTIVFILSNVSIKDILQAKMPIKLISLLCGVIILYFFKDQMYKIISQTVDAISAVLTGEIESNPYESNKERWNITLEGLSVVFRNPLGVGPGISRLIVGEQIGRGSADMHNWPLEIAADLGVTFFLFYVSYIIWLVFKIREISSKSSRPSIKVIGYGLIYAVLGMSISIIAPSSLIYFIPFWILTSLLISFVNLFSLNVNYLEVEK